VFPVAGLGTRFLPASKAIPKEMLTVVDRPLIQIVVDEAREAGIEHFIFVTGRNKSAIEDHFDRQPELEDTLAARGKTEELEALLRDLPAPGETSFVRQQEPLGLGHAVWCARDWIGREPFAVLLPDELTIDSPSCTAQLVAAHGKTGGNVVAVMDVPRDQTKSYGIAAVKAGKDGLAEITGLVEKPKPEEAPSGWGVMGRYVFTPAIFESIARTKPGAGGEIQLTDAIGGLLPELDVYGYTFDEGRYDIGSKLDYLRATVELALARDDLGDEFRRWLSGYVREQGIG
jgi:UTP--glucose-1-phosphate uridylyltransferase